MSKVPPLRVVCGIPLGKVQDVRTENGQLLGRIVWDESLTDEDVKRYVRIMHEWMIAEDKWKEAHDAEKA